MSDKKTNFELVNLVLDQLQKDVDSVYGDRGVDIVKAKLAELTAGYKRLLDPSFPKIDYSAPETRLAYVYTYVASHADWVYQVIKSTRKSLGDALLEKERLVVTCLGGGPGSEFVGLVQFLTEEKSESLKSVTTYLCDHEQAWADCWTEIGPEVEATFNLSANFQGLDVTDVASWSKQKKFLSADLFMSVFFASEISRFGNASDQFWAEVSASAKSGAMMLIIDNNGTSFVDYVQKKIIGSAWDVAESGAKDFRPSSHEEKSALGKHLKNFERLPRMKGDSVFWILRKK